MLTGSQRRGTKRPVDETTTTVDTGLHYIFAANASQASPPSQILQLEGNVMASSASDESLRY